MRLLRSTVQVATTDSVMIMRVGEQLGRTTRSPPRPTCRPTLGSPAAARLIFGDWADVLIGIWSRARHARQPVRERPHTDAATCKVRAHDDACDIAARHVEASRACTDAAPGR